MSASKSGSYIVVNGLGNTLSSVAADINDAAFFSEVSAGVFELNCTAVHRRLYVADGGELIIGDPNDFSVSETLQNNQGGVYYRGQIYASRGGSLKVYGNSVLNLSLGNNRHQYNYWDGEWLMIGDATYKPLLIGHRLSQNIIRDYAEGDPDKDRIHWENMIIGSADTAGGNILRFNASERPANHVFRNITFDPSYGTGGNDSNLFYWECPHVGYESMVVENLTFVNGGRYCPFHPVNAMGYYKGITITGSGYNYYPIRADNPIIDSLSLRYGEGGDRLQRHGQKFWLIEDLVMDQTGYVHDVHLRCGSTGCLKNPTLSRIGGGDRFTVNTSAYLMLWGTITVPDWDLSVDIDGKIAIVHDLDLTVQDELGNPIEGAEVVIRASTGEEKVYFQTKANGKLQAIYDLECALLMQRLWYNSVENRLVSSAYNWEADFKYGTNGISSNGTTLYAPVDADVDGAGYPPTEGWMKLLSSSTDRHRWALPVGWNQAGRLWAGKTRLEFDWLIHPDNPLVGQSPQHGFGGDAFINPVYDPPVLQAGLQHYTLTYDGLDQNESYVFIGNQGGYDYTNAKSYLKNLTLTSLDGIETPHHIVTVFKEGYRPASRACVMNQSRTDTITLKRIDAKVMTF